MTPRIKDTFNQPELTWFSEELLNQIKKKDFVPNLTGDGPLFTVEHPALIKAKFLFNNDLSSLRFNNSIMNWTFESFKNQIEAESHHPQIPKFGGFPWHIHQFLSSKAPEALIDFGQLGTVYLTTKTKPLPDNSKLEVHDYLLAAWLNYALSPELWGTSGKWPRFHHRLHTLFEHNGLLIGEDFPGYYRLKKNADWLIHKGIHGKKTESDFQLIFPWDFSLSKLIEIEKILSREL
jgi:hypothetical protein